MAVPSIHGRIRQQQFQERAAAAPDPFAFSFHFMPETPTGRLDEIGRRLGELSQFRGVSGYGLDAYATNQPDILRAMQAKTADVTDLLRQLQGGATPEQLGFLKREDIGTERQSLISERQRLLNPQEQVESPLQRLQQALFGMQAAGGLARGGAGAALRGSGIPTQIQSVLAGGLGQLRQEPGAEEGSLVGGIGLEELQQLLLEGLGPRGAVGESSFNVFNPPPQAGVFT